MKKIQFIVLTCDAYLNSRVKSIRETWGRNQEVKFLSDSQSEDNSIIGFNTQKNYWGIYEKYLNFFKTYNFDFFDYYFFADDDTFVNLKNLNNLDLDSKHKPFCIGRHLCLNPDGTDLWGNQTGTDVSSIKGEKSTLPLHYPSGGSGFIISQSGCKNIQKYVNESSDLPYCKFSDVSVGFWMRNADVIFKGNENFWWDTHEKLLQNNWEKYTDDKSFITFHYVNNEMMYDYHQKYNY